jgi:beta-phosphoglucomutase
MDWLQQYQLFLFDFDGLLVNTEEIHYLAYKQMCAAREVDFSWDFNRYCQAAHYDAHALKNQIYVEFPALYDQEPNWDILYAEKKEELRKLFQTGAVRLMPGVDKMLKYLQDNSIPRCVVTHSPDDLVGLVRKQNPILNTIPNWITREQYSQPKPHPECYQKAISTFAKPMDRVVGFEDTPRGLWSLLGTNRAKAILVCEANYPEIPEFISKGVCHFRSFKDLFS